MMLLVVAIAGSSRSAHRASGTPQSAPKRSSSLPTCSTVLGTEKTHFPAAFTTIKISLFAQARRIRSQIGLTRAIGRTATSVRSRTLHTHTHSHTISHYHPAPGRTASHVAPSVVRMPAGLPRRPSTRSMWPSLSRCREDTESSWAEPETEAVLYSGCAEAGGGGKVRQGGGSCCADSAYWWARVFPSRPTVSHARVGLPRQYWRRLPSGGRASAQAQAAGAKPCFIQKNGRELGRKPHGQKEGKRCRAGDTWADAINRCRPISSRRH